MMPSRGLPHHNLYLLSDKYGPVVGVFFGSTPVVVVNGWHALVESLHNRDLNGRIHFFLSSLINGGPKGISGNESDVFHEQKSFTMKHKYGSVKKHHEVVISDETNGLLQEVREAQGSVAIQNLVSLSVINIIFGMVTGRKHQRKDPRLLQLQETINKAFRSQNSTGRLNPISKLLLKLRPEKSLTFRAMKDTKDFFEATIREHQATLDPSEPRSFIDEYLVMIEQQKDDPDSSYSVKQLCAICSNIFMGATDTLSSVVSFGLQLVMESPSVLAKIQKELDTVLGPDRLPSLDDRYKLVYTYATLQEVYRFRAPSPITIPHKAMKNTTLQGYNIPTEAIVLNNLYSAHMDRDYWGDPDVFRPERFINADGTPRKHDRLIPFGRGQRRCLGEPESWKITFAFFSSLLHQFTFTFDPTLLPPTSEGVAGLVYCPSHFKVFAKPRY
ncbi:methyl farnesoate epoxidase-like isoform X2 [Eriocheir sinensis]|nr:methyl farnesoate epoxidase-like isoform X2 [Eriocheir sinensis]